MAFFRQFAACTLLTIVSVVSFAGTGLHLLPGCDHFHGHCDSCDEHGHCSHANPADGDDHRSESDCAICRFLAIPWSLSSPPEIVDGGRPFEFLVAVSASVPAIEAIRPYGARAPPRMLSYV